MKLSMSLVAKYLERYHPECHIIHDTQSIKGVRLLSAPQPKFSLEYIYLGAAAGYFQDQRYTNALLLANGENQIICRDADYEELLNDVLSAFDYYAEFEQKLLLASAQHHPLEEMMRLMGPAIDCTLLVFDIEGYFLSSYQMEEAGPQPFMANIVHKGRLSFQGIGEVIVDADGKVSHDLSNAPQYMSIKDVDEPGAVTMYLCQGDERVGFFMAFVRDTSQVPMCLCLAPFLGECCANAAEFAEKTSLRQSSNYVFAALLNGEKLAPAVVRKLASNLRIGSNATLIVFQSISVRNYTLHKMLMNEIRLSNIPCIACEYEERVAIMTASPAVEDIICFISNRIAAHNMAIGVSMPFQDINQLSIALEQAYFALDASLEPGIRYCRDLALSYLLQTLREHERTKHLLHPALGALEKYDSENNTEFLRTIHVFLQTGCSQAASADALHVHLNTLKYRLRRIQEMTDIDFGNQEERFYIWLSLKLREGC